MNIFMVKLCGNPNSERHSITFMMRLDKMFSECGILTRKESTLAARAGEIAVNGKTVRKTDIHIEPGKDIVTYRGEVVEYSDYTFVMLNKPAGYISATEDGRLPVVTELLPSQLQRIGLFPCGRLDRDTVGLMILTNDGLLAHRLLSPRHHAEKTYGFRCAHPLTEEDVAAMASGMMLDDVLLKPARLTPDIYGLSGSITLTEGKYHQIKRMFIKRDNEITFLERLSFGGVTLDPALERGQWRYLTKEEIATLRDENINP